MLVLTRRKGQSLLIGDGIEITVNEIQGDRVKLGIIAPKEITILREELVRETERANTDAAVSDIDIESLDDILGRK